MCFQTYWCWDICFYRDNAEETLHENWSFPLRITSENMQYSGVKLEKYTLILPSFNLVWLPFRMDIIGYCTANVWKKGQGILYGIFENYELTTAFPLPWTRYLYQELCKRTDHRPDHLGTTRQREILPNNLIRRYAVSIWEYTGPYSAAVYAVSLVNV